MLTVKSVCQQMSKLPPRVLITKPNKSEMIRPRNSQTDMRDLKKIISIFSPALSPSSVYCLRFSTLPVTCS